MTVRVELNGGPDAPTTWTNITDKVKVFGGMRVGGNAHLGEIGTGSGFDLDDDAGEVILPVKRVVRIRETHTSPDTILLRGRIADKGVARGGGGHVDDARSYDVQLDDENTDLRGIPVRRWPRPQESDYRRVVALWRRFLKGSPRATTRLHIKYRSGSYEGLGSVRNANRVTLPKQVYTDTDPYGVLRDISEAAGKEFFVTVDSELFYDLPTSTRYSSSLLITDESPNDSDEFPPDAQARADQDGTEFLSGIVITYGRDKRVARVRSSVEAAHDYWREVIAEDATSAADAGARAKALLSRQAREDRTYSIVLDLDEDEVDLVKYGQTISFESSATGVKTPVTLRIGRLLWEPVAPRRYRAIMELGFPKKMAPRIRRRSRGTNPGNPGGGGSDGGDGGGVVTPPPTDGDSSMSPVLIDDFDGDSVSDVGEHILDHWIRPFTGSTPAEMAITALPSVGTSHDLEVPAGASIGRILFLVYGSSDADITGALRDQFVTLGYTLLEDFQNQGVLGNSGAAFVRLIDGSEGFTGSGDTITVTTPGSETIQYYMAVIEGVAGASAGIDWSSSQSSDNDPASVSGWAGQNEIGYAIGFDDTLISGGSYTNRASLSSGGIALRVQQGDLNGAFNPGAFTMEGTLKHTFTIAGRFTRPEWGTIPYGAETGASWAGGNPYLKVSTGTATVSTDDELGLIAIGGDNTTVAMVLTSDAPDDPNGYPDGPWSEGNAALRYKWKVNVLGDTSDSDENLLEWQIITQDWRGSFRVHLGDGVTYSYQSGGDERGIVVVQKSGAGVFSPFVPKTLVADTWYQTRLDFRGDTIRMKLWADGTAEPVDWDIEVARVPEDPGELDVAQLYLRVYGNTGMTFSFDTSWAQVGEDVDPDVFGSILTHAGDAAWWAGGNPWGLVEAPIGSLYGLADSALFVEGDEAPAEIEIVVVPEPETPLYVAEAAGVPWSLTGRFRYTGDDDDGGGDPDRFLRIVGPRDEFALDIDNGSALLSMLVLSGGNDSATLPALIADAWYLFRYRKGATTTGVKVWAEGDDEPEAFDVSVDTVHEPGTDRLGINIAAEGLVGGDPFRVELDWLKVDAPDGALDGIAGEVYGLTPTPEVP